MINQLNVSTRLHYTIAWCVSRTDINCIDSDLVNTLSFHICGERTCGVAECALWVYGSDVVVSAGGWNAACTLRDHRPPQSGRGL